MSVQEERGGKCEEGYFRPVRDPPLPAPFALPLSIPCRRLSFPRPAHSLASMGGTQQRPRQQDVLCKFMMGGARTKFAILCAQNGIAPCCDVRKIQRRGPLTSLLLASHHLFPLRLPWSQGGRSKPEAFGLRL